MNKKLIWLTFIVIFVSTIVYLTYASNLSVTQVASMEILNEKEIALNDDEIAVTLIPNLDGSGLDYKSDSFTIVLMDENISSQIRSSPIVEDAFVLYQSSGGGRDGNNFKYIDPKATVFLPKTEQKTGFIYPKVNEVVISSEAASMHKYKVGDDLVVKLLKLKNDFSDDEKGGEGIEEVQKIYKISSIVNFDDERYYLSMETEQEIKTLLNEERYYNFDATVFIIKRDALGDFKDTIQQYLPDYYEVIEYDAED